MSEDENDAPENDAAYAELTTDKLRIEISSEVIDFLDKHAQRTWNSREAGGQLFATIKDLNWTIIRATGPHTNDVRSRFGFLLRRHEAQVEINLFFKEGLHYVGDWHTHPETTPKPSQQDCRSMQNLVSKSQYELPGLLMLIVGNSGVANDWWLSVHTLKGKSKPINFEAQVDL